tara:strand:- start:1284 stop:1853 length:570 start_codon:yes stop_codon:yes gene_type:complete
MEQVMGGIMRFLGSVKVQSISSHIKLGTAGPAVISLRNTSTQSVEVELPDPSRSAGGQLVIKCATSSEAPVAVEGLAYLSPGDSTLIACDGLAWYEISTERRKRQGSLKFSIEPGQVRDIEQRIVAPWLADTHTLILTLSVFHKAAQGLLCALPPTVAGRVDGQGFSINARLKNSTEEPLFGSIKWTTL